MYCKTDSGVKNLKLFETLSDAFFFLEFFFSEITEIIWTMKRSTKMVKLLYAVNSLANYNIQRASHRFDIIFHLLDVFCFCITKN